MPKASPIRTTLAVLGTLVLTVLSPLTQTHSLAAATTASLDTTYGQGGLGLVSQAPGGATTLVDQDDAGRVVTASQYSGGSWLGRLSATGTPDGLGMGWSDAQVRALDASHGRITVVRSRILAYVDRVLDDGTPDVTFGENGRVEFPLGTGLYTGAVDDAGRTVIGGYFRQTAGSGYAYSSWLARLDAQGRLDATFNAGGEQPGVVPSPGWAVMDLALDGDRIVTVERRADGSATRLTRYTADGSPDVGFGDGGTAAPGPYLNAVAVDAAHRVLATVFDSYHQYAVQRWTAAGEVDTSFGRQGVSLGPVPSNACTADEAGITVLADGGSVVAPTGVCVGAVQVVRLTERGFPDASFAPSGAFEISAVGPYAISAATSVFQQADGDLVVGVRSSAMGAIRVRADRQATTSVFTPLPTSRILDTTVGTTPRTVQIAGLHGVPADATAVVVNSGISSASTSSYLRVVPYGKDAQVATQHVAPGRAISNLVVVQLQNGRLQAKVSAGTARLTLDLAGYYADSAGATFTPLPTSRILDTTVGTTPRTVQIAGLHGVPADATAVVVNSGISSASTSSYLRVVPYGKDAQVATQHVAPGRAISNLVVVQLQNGRLQAKVSAGTARLTLDLAGYYADSAGATFTPLPTSRILDTTVGTTPRTVQIAGLHGVPADATAVVVNSGISSASTSSYLRVVPYGKDAQVATQHVAPGRAISNLVVVQLQNGRLQAKVSAGTARLTLDLAGYYSG